MGLLETVGSPQRPQLREFAQDVLLGLTAPRDVLKECTFFLGRGCAQDAQRIDTVEDEIADATFPLFGRRTVHQCTLTSRAATVHLVQYVGPSRVTRQNREGESHVKNMLKEFRDFIATGNMIELAVAFILGAAVKQVIDTFIANVANPIIGAIFGKPNLDDLLRFTLRSGNKADPTDDTVLAIGPVLTQIISLMLVGFVLFLVVKAYNKLRKPKPTVPAAPSEVAVLVEIRDLLKVRG